MKKGIIIQALLHMNNDIDEELFMQINGKNVLEHTIDSALECKNTEVIILTSEINKPKIEELPLVQEKNFKIYVWKNSFLSSIKEIVEIEDIDIIARVIGNSPLLIPKIVDKCFENHTLMGKEYSYFNFSRGLKPTEILSKNIFRNIDEEMYKNEKAINVCSNIIKNSNIDKNYYDIWKYIYGAKYKQEWDADFSISKGKVNIQKVSELLETYRDKNLLIDLLKKCKEKARQYDLIYSMVGEESAYSKHYSQTEYYTSWKRVVAILKKYKFSQIFDVGCGIGQFANFLFDSGFYKYEGMDFSEKAIESAKLLNKKQADKFFVGNIFEDNIFDREYDVVILLEVLEHIEYDIEVINKIPKGKSIIFSVPNFDCAQHVRYFNSLDEVLRRYDKYIDIKHYEEIQHGINGAKLYLIMGIKN